MTSCLRSEEWKRDYRRIRKSECGSWKKRLEIADLRKGKNFSIKEWGGQKTENMKSEKSKSHAAI